MYQHALWRKYIPDKRFRCFSQYFLPIAVCWLILLVIMGLRIYFATLSHESDVSELMSANRNLTNLNDKLSVLENQITDLTAVKQELETERNNLTGQIQNMETNWNTLNITQTQWCINEYGPNVNNVSERRCRECQKDWELFQSSCYLINDPPDRKTREDAQDDCRAEHTFLNTLNHKSISLDLNIMFFPQLLDTNTTTTSY
ncbi:C-type lectin domain family 12 member B-like [Perca fluviatilis]|uniref:C-type lectin domain family 12 member B-like n=1 Tax=Perca fluviatilis TaxID=8168 RepID=UPI001962481A|nr:C-type lectin domain family 12 member B-like [Perca fluviatilis]